MLDRLTPKRIDECLIEISKKTNLKHYQVDGLWYIQSLNWDQHQTLAKDKRGDDDFPDCPAELLQTNSGVTPEQFQSSSRVSPEQLQSNSGVTPEQVQSNSGVAPELVVPEVEVEVKGEEEVKEEVEVGSGRVSGTLRVPSVGKKNADRPPPEKPVPEKLSPEKLVETWNTITESKRPRVTEITESRRRKIKQRLSEHPGIEFWDSVFRRVIKSNFLMGAAGRESWTGATFDWLMVNDRHSVKIAEGTYDNGSNGQTTSFKNTDYKKGTW